MTQIYCSIAPELKDVTGEYFADCARKAPSAAALNADDAAKLWEISEKAVGLQSGKSENEKNEVQW